MDETLIGVHSLADTSSDPTRSCAQHSTLHRTSVESSQQSSPYHSNATSDNGTSNRGLFHPAGLIGQAITFIQILADTVRSRVAIRVNRRTVTAMGGTPVKNEHHQHQKSESLSPHEESPENMNIDYLNSVFKSWL
jgi:hypothetical protein